MIAKGAYCLPPPDGNTYYMNIHYDVGIFPLLHIIFDSIGQHHKGVN